MTVIAVELTGIDLIHHRQLHCRQLTGLDLQISDQSADLPITALSQMLGIDDRRTHGPDREQGV